MTLKTPKIVTKLAHLSMKKKTNQFLFTEFVLKRSLILNQTNFMTCLDVRIRTKLWILPSLAQICSLLHYTSRYTTNTSTAGRSRDTGREGLSRPPAPVTPISCRPLSPSSSRAIADRPSYTRPRTCVCA